MIKPMFFRRWPRDKRRKLLKGLDFPIVISFEIDPVKESYNQRMYDICNNDVKIVAMKKRGKVDMFASESPTLRKVTVKFVQKREYLYA